MQDSVPEAMPKFFESWCSKFDDDFQTTAQRRNFRHYLAGLLGESSRKNLWAMTANTVSVSYHSMYNFLHDSPWNADKLNERRLSILAETRQTRIKPGFDLIIDDSGHRKSGASTAGVGRQYIGQIGKIDNGIVMVTSHAHDGIKGIPLDVNLYKHATSLPEGKEDPDFTKKPDLALALIDRCLARGLQPGSVLLDAGYGNNGPLLVEIEKRDLVYVAAISKSRRVHYKMPGDKERTKHRLDDVAKTLAPDSFQPITLPLEKPRTVWVATLSVYLPKMSGKKIIAIQLNAPTIEEADEIDYYITNAPPEQATAGWIAQTYSKRNWVEVFYREAKGWLGITEYEVRDERSIYRHWILVFTAYTLIIWQQLTGGLRRWSTESLDTFGQAYKAFRTAVECLLVRWIGQHEEVFAAHRSSLGLIWV